MKMNRTRRKIEDRAWSIVYVIIGLHNTRLITATAHTGYEKQERGTECTSTGDQTLHCSTL